MRRKLFQVVSTLVLIGILAVVAFGYVSVPVTTFPAQDPNRPDVMGSATFFVNQTAKCIITIEDSNDDSFTVLAEDGTVEKGSSIFVGQTTITDATGTTVFDVYKTTYNIYYKITIPGRFYKEIVFTDGSGAIANGFVELTAKKRNLVPVITGCQITTQ